MTFFDFLGNYWWLVFPFSGLFIGGFGAISAYFERRRKDRYKLEELRIRAQSGQSLEQQQFAPAPQIPQRASAPAPNFAQRILDEHDRVNQRWLEYELDVAKLIDFPLMSDMREQLTIDFHRAKRHADAVRPDSVEQLQDPNHYADYREAVNAYALAFDIAEAEAQRRRQRDFSHEERIKLEQARKLIAMASDEAGSAAERQSAYRQARKALDGLIVVPRAASEDLEQRIAGAIGRGQSA
ncbi:hypothetical protein [Humidisolicoccus flavus]|uniref:hypothetical protein n=1 Tax=Humidisolicoccus flavus TaxID=3111414 RepID=UPI0032499558